MDPITRVHNLSRGYWRFENGFNEGVFGVKSFTLEIIIDKDPVKINNVTTNDRTMTFIAWSVRQIIDIITLRIKFLDFCICKLSFKRRKGLPFRRN